MADKSKAPQENVESGIIAKTIENIFLPEIIKKAVVAGLKSVIGTEEGLRSLASAAIPRDALNYLLQQIDNSKNEILRKSRRRYVSPRTTAARSPHRKSRHR
jgi:hypothetical protein